MVYPLTPQMHAIRARLQAGERLTARAAWMADTGIHRSAVHLTLKRWCDIGDIHIAGWHRYLTGKPAPIYAWGAQLNVKKPKTLTKYQSVKRWRQANPDLHAAQINRAKARRLAARPPRLDALMSALMGAR